VRGEQLYLRCRRVAVGLMCAVSVPVPSLTRRLAGMRGGAGPAAVHARTVVFFKEWTNGVSILSWICSSRARRRGLLLPVVDDSCQG